MLIPYYFLDADNTKKHLVYHEVFAAWMTDTVQAKHTGKNKGKNCHIYLLMYFNT